MHARPRERETFGDLLLQRRLARAASLLAGLLLVPLGHAPAEEAASPSDDRPAASLAPETVVELFALDPESWTVRGDVLRGELETSAIKPATLDAYRVTGFDYRVQVKAKWHHWIWVQIDGHTFELSRGHWFNGGTMVYDDLQAREVVRQRPGPKVDDPDRWCEIGATLRDRVIAFHYDGQEAWHRTIPAAPGALHEVRFGLAVQNCTIELRDLAIRLMPEQSLIPLGLDELALGPLVGSGPANRRDARGKDTVLVGVEATLSQNARQMAVGSIRPIFETPQGRFRASNPLGTPGLLPIRVEARPGYAVGGIVATAGECVDGFRLVFMRRVGDHLDPDDRYLGRWVGGRGDGDGDEERVGGDGSPAVGLIARCDKGVRGVGLIQRKTASENARD